MKISLRTWILAGAGLLIIFAVFGFCQRRAGKQEGAVNQKIVASAERVKSIEVAVDKADKAAGVETKKLVTKNADYRAARTKVETKGDTVISDGQTVVMPSAAAALKRADSLSAQVTPTVVEHARSDSLKTVLVGALSDHVDLLQQEKKPRIGFKTGVALGVVATGVTVYVAVRIIKALAHR